MKLDEMRCIALVAIVSIWGATACTQTPPTQSGPCPKISKNVSSASFPFVLYPNTALDKTVSCSTSCARELSVQTFDYTYEYIKIAGLDPALTYTISMYGLQNIQEGRFFFFTTPDFIVPYENPLCDLVDRILHEGYYGYGIYTNPLVCTVTNVTELYLKVLNTSFDTYQGDQVAAYGGVDFVFRMAVAN